MTNRNANSMATHEENTERSERVKNLFHKKNFSVFVKDINFVHSQTHFSLHFEHHHHNLATGPTPGGRACRKGQNSLRVDWLIEKIAPILARVIELEIFIIADNSIAQHIVNSTAAASSPSFIDHNEYISSLKACMWASVKSIYEIKFFGLLHNVAARKFYIKPRDEKIVCIGMDEERAA